MIRVDVIKESIRRFMIFSHVDADFSAPVSSTRILNLPLSRLSSMPFSWGGAS